MTHALPAVASGMRLRCQHMNIADQMVRFTSRQEEADRGADPSDDAHPINDRVDLSARAAARSAEGLLLGDFLCLRHYADEYAGGWCERSWA